ncbi:MAG: glycosyltransferase [Patescibacteria group bacterium]
MKKDPLVSIIIPAYNAEKYIKTTINSALKQTYQNIEIIVIDDGSTDKTKNIIQSIQDPRIIYIHQENQGQSAARNAGIKIAKGEYIALLDSDDLFLPQKIEKQVNFLEIHPDCGVCYCKIYNFFDDRPDKLFYNPVPNYSGFIFDKLLKHSVVNPLTAVLRKEHLERYGGFKDDWRRCDEQYLWLKLAFNKVKFCYLDEVLAYYRVSKNSLSNQSVYLKENYEKFLELLDMVESWLGPDERKKYPLDELKKSAAKKLFIGKLMAKGNILSKALLSLYNLRLRLKLKKVS